jgi:hypothetical protein
MDIQNQNSLLCALPVGPLILPSTIPSPGSAVHGDSEPIISPALPLPLLPLLPCFELLFLWAAVAV